MRDNSEVLEHDNESVSEEILSIKEEMIDFKYQPLVDEIYASLSVENQTVLNDKYTSIKERNKALLSNPLYRLYYYNYLIRKVCYFTMSLISFINVYFWGAFIKAAVMWFVQGIVLRMWEPSFKLLKWFLEIAYIFVGNGVWGLVNGDYDFDPSAIKFGYFENVDEVIIQGYEISVYLTFFTIVWFIINLLVFYLRNRKHWGDDANHEFKFDLGKSLFMLQGDKDDDYNYIKKNFIKRYNRFVGSDFQKRKYLTAYINVLESDIFVSKPELTSVQKRKIFFKVNYATFESVIGMFTYIFCIALICLGILTAYSMEPDALYSNALVEVLHQFDWWNNMSLFCTNLMNGLHLSGLYTSSNAWLNECFGIVGTIVLIYFVFNVNKRCIRPSIRHYRRACNYYTKINKGVYDGNEKFINISRYRAMAMMFYLIVLPMLIFIFYNI